MPADLKPNAETVAALQEADWNAAIEAAAEAIEKYGLDRVNGMKDYPAAVASACAYHVRALKR